jgi:hypothetical protein
MANARLVIGQVVHIRRRRIEPFFGLVKPDLNVVIASQSFDLGAPCFLVLLGKDYMGEGGLLFGSANSASHAAGSAFSAPIARHQVLRRPGTRILSRPRTLYAEA